MKIDNLDHDVKMMVMGAAQHVLSRSSSMAGMVADANTLLKAEFPDTPLIMNTWGIARVCHEANRAYCMSLGDDSQPSWEDAPKWQKDSAVAGVEFHMKGDHQPSDSHQNWMDQKIAEGWVYGPEKDPEKKEHPCMVPYDDLPIEQRTKDFIFIGIVHSFKKQ